MNIGRRWKRILAVGCSHGIHADKDALKAICKFRDDWKPDTTIHLGDFCDTAAFRSGAAGSSDESAPVQPDVDNGLAFLERLECTHVLAGNHEDRLWRLAASPNALISHCALDVIAQIKATCKALKADFQTYTGAFQGVTIGGYRYMHGVMYGENATRDHAEAYGNVVHAHTHRPSMAKGRRSDNPTGYCVGALVEPREMHYAKTRRATLAWGRGFVWGEYCDTQSVLWLHELPPGVPWRLPTMR